MGGLFGEFREQMPHVSQLQHGDHEIQIGDNVRFGGLGLVSISGMSNRLSPLRWAEAPLTLDFGHVVVFLCESNPELVNLQDFPVAQTGIDSFR